MSAIVPTIFSTQLASVKPQSQGYGQLAPSDMHGRVRQAAFTYVAGGAEAQNTVLGLCYIPKNARILKSDIWTSAGPGANVNFDIGLSGKNGNGFIDDGGFQVGPGDIITDPVDPIANQQADSANWLGNFAPANAAASGNFADTIAHHVGYTLAKDCILTATIKTAAVTAVFTLFGYVRYIVD